MNSTATSGGHALLRITLAVVGLGTLLLGCADAGGRGEPLAPTAPVAVRGGGRELAALPWDRALGEAVVGSETIGPEGGVLELPATGLRVVFSAGAVAEPVRFVAVAVAGPVVSYAFWPHVARFGAPVRVEQRVEGTAAADPAVAARLVAGHFQGELVSLGDRAVLPVDELVPVTVDAGGATVSFIAPGFSGYHLATN